MTGSLQTKGKYYYVVVRMPDEFGVEKQKWINTNVEVKGDNKKEAARRHREILSELEYSKVTYSENILFVDWIGQWMEQKENEVRQNTFEGYQMNVDKHILPFFKPLKLTLQAVTALHIQQYFSKKLKEGLSANSIKKHNVVLKGALQDAMKKNLIPFNPVDRATLPAIKKFVGKAYSVEQAGRLLGAVDNEQLKPAIILGLFYGLRRSEVLGLRWRDIDFEMDTISIRNTVVRQKTTIEHERTKSRASKRTMYIIPETRDYFLELKQRQDKNRTYMGKAYNDNDHVCVWDDGNPFKPHYISRSFVKILEKHNLPRIRFHELRHTAGSLLLNKGLSIKQIQEYLGHEQVSTTLDIYGHLSFEGKKEAADTIGSLLTGGASRVT